MGSYRAPAGAAGLDRVEKTLGIKKKRAAVTLDTSGIATDVSNFIPASSVVLAIKVEVTTTVGGTYIDKIGVDGDDDMFASSIGDGNLVTDGDILVTGGNTAGNRGNFFLAADALRITCRHIPTAGAVNVTMLYVDGASL